MERRFWLGIVLPAVVAAIVILCSAIDWETSQPVTPALTFNGTLPQSTEAVRSGQFHKLTRSAAYFDGRIYEAQYSSLNEGCAVRVFRDNEDKTFSHEFMTEESARCGASGIAFWKHSGTIYVYLQQYYGDHELARYRYNGPDNAGTYIDSTHDDRCINHIAVDQAHDTLWKSTCHSPDGEQIHIHRLPDMRELDSFSVPGCRNGATDVWVGFDENMHILCTTGDAQRVMVYNSTSSNKEDWTTKIYEYTIPLDGTCGTDTNDPVCNYPHFTDPDNRSRLFLIDHTNTRELKERQVST